MPFQPPDKITPPPTQDQLWGSTAVRTPEQKLWLAVLESAIVDGDFEWLESYTFELWCESVGLEPGAVRRRAREVCRVAA